MDYFYAKPEDVNQNSILIKDDESKHLIRVLRKNVGDRVFVTDGLDTMYEAVIENIGKSDTRCKILALHKKFNEPDVDVTLTVSLLKNPNRFDFLVEKTTELGVRQIIPILCERTISHRDSTQRLKKIALSAMKQSGRSWLPKISQQEKFDNLIKTRSNYHLALIPHEQTSQTNSLITILNANRECKKVLIVIGPEGGFTEDEMRQASESGFIPISLGSRRLRAETAAIASVDRVIELFR